MCATKIPSTAFCLLLRLFTLRCTEKQMTLMLNHVDSPYIRCTGFLYLRYASDPSGIWSWFEPFLYDDEPVQVAANSSKPEITIGSYVRSLLTDMNYHGTLLPRLPVAVERDVKVKLLQAEQIEDRAKSHANDNQKMLHFLKVGNRVRALYGDEENPTAWYDAVVDRVLSRDEETGADLMRPKFLVTFPEYGNTEWVTLGEIDMPSSDSMRDSRTLEMHQNDFRGHDRDWERGRDSESTGRRAFDHDIRRGYSRGACATGEDRPVRRTCYDEKRGYRDSEDGHRYSKRGVHGEEGRWERDRCHEKAIHPLSRSRGHDRHDSTSPQPPAQPSNEHFLMEEVLRREREKSAAKGKAYASRPPTFKNSLSAKQNERGQKRARSPEHCRPRSNKQSRAKDSSAKPSTSVAAPQEKTAEERAALEEKKRKLIARYG